MTTDESPRYVIRYRKGRPIKVDYQILLWRARGGPDKLATAVAALQEEHRQMILLGRVETHKSAWAPSFE